MCSLPPVLEWLLDKYCCALLCVHPVGLELFADSHRGVVPIVLLLCWCATVVLQHIWQQVKADATLGHRIMGEHSALPLEFAGSNNR